MLIESIGIPRGLLWYKYGLLWKTFFTALGLQVVVSPATDRSLLEQGQTFSTDEVCLASQTYLGHIASLIGQCDAVFVPCYESQNVRVGFCTKYQSLPDMVRATFRDEPVKFLSLNVSDVMDKKGLGRSYIDFATTKLGASLSQAVKAWKRAQKAQEAFDKEKAYAQEQAFKLLAKARKDKKSTPLTILLVGHPYICHDEYLAHSIVNTLQEAGILVLYADESNSDMALRKSFQVSDTLPWLINRELLGSLMLNKKKVDGIVMVSAFPCGPDSLFDDLVIRTVHDIPLLNLVIDAQSGTAGVETRIESFVDILRFQEKGSYLG